nr:MAG TPA: Argonaute linker 2 domain protein [Caudoviricetes sp.]
MFASTRKGWGFSINKNPVAAQLRGGVKQCS